MITNKNHPLHRFKVCWEGSDSILELESAQGLEGDSIEFRHGYTVNAVLENLADDTLTPPMAFEVDELCMFQPIRLREETDYLVAVTLPGKVEELEEARQLSSNAAWPFRNGRLLSSFKRTPARYWKMAEVEGKPTTTITGQLNFGSHAGVADLSLDDRFSFLVEVAASKISYFKDFRLLLDRLAEEIVDLVLQVGSSTGIEFQADLTENEQDDENRDYIRLFHLRNLFSNDNLQEATETALRRPHSNLVSETRLEDPAAATTPDLEKIAADPEMLDLASGGSLASIFSGYTPREIFQTETYDTFDTPENRYVKDFLEELLLACNRVEKSVSSRCDGKGGLGRRWMSVLPEVKHWNEILDEILSASFWREIGPMSHFPSNSQVLQKRAGYRDILQADLRLRLGLSLPWAPEVGLDGVDGDIRPVYDLYEIWCFWELRRILGNILIEVPEKSSLWNISSDGLEINLRKGCRVVFEGLLNEELLSIELSYNKRFRGRKESWSISFDPDFTIRVASVKDKAASKGSKRLIHFDAKYRLNRIPSNRTEDESGDRSETLSFAKSDDLVKMHAYKDAIRSSLGSFILYPGTSLSLYQCYAGELLPAVGAFPLRPNKASGDEHVLERKLLGMINLIVREFAETK